ncbi:cache domain-containing protein, partial [Halarcobacter ebronensis]
MKSITIKFKTIMLIVGIIIAMSIIILILSIYETNALTKIQTTQIEKEALSQKAKELKNYTDIIKSILEKKNEQDSEDKKIKAIEQIKNIKFGDTGYFWIHDLNLKMVMHPTREDLTNKDISDLKDANGLYIFKEMNKLVLEKKEGIVSYKVPKPGEKVATNKFSYVFLFEPWGWVIGTGAYVDDIEKNIIDMEKRSSEKIESLVIKITLLTLSIIVLSYFLMILAFNQLMKKPLDIFKEYFSQFLKFVSMENNRYTPATVTNKDEINELLLMINETAIEFDKKLKDDMRVMGEVVLTADRIEKGIYNCRIHSDSKNPMIMTLKKSLNKMLDVLDNTMQNIKNSLEAYENHDYTRRVKINKDLKATMLSVMESINKLGSSLSENAKTNLENGQVLEENSNIMTSSMENLAKKANDQAASLEETAAAVEEITSITRSNAENA